MLDLPAVFHLVGKFQICFGGPNAFQQNLANPKAEETCHGLSFCLQSIPTTIVMAVSASRDLNSPLLSTDAGISSLNINILTKIYCYFHC